MALKYSNHQSSVCTWLYILAIQSVVHVVAHSKVKGEKQPKNLMVTFNDWCFVARQPQWQGWSNLEGESCLVLVWCEKDTGLSWLGLGPGIVGMHYPLRLTSSYILFIHSVVHDDNNMVLVYCVIVGNGDIRFPVVKYVFVYIVL